MPGATMAVASDSLMTVTVVVYSLAILGYAAEFAFGRVARKESVTQRPRVLVGAGVPGSDAPVTSGSEPSLGPAGEAGEPAVADAPAAPDIPESASTPPRDPAAAVGRAAIVLTGAGWIAHLGAIVTRGLAAQRLPWGNMYEFTVMLTFAAVTAYLVLLARHRARYLGLFVMVPVTLGLGLAVTVLYAAAGPLVPALQSYWIAIHVTAAVTASGVFTVATAASVLYLVAERYERRRGGGQKIGLSGIAHRLPDKSVLNRLAYRLVALGFPIWTFAVIAGAIWAEAAWGRYWGWDPKETWSFITWVVYAGYLHAQSTAGWKGRAAAVVALLGFLAFLFNFFGVNIWIPGLHSYAGLS